MDIRHAVWFAISVGIPLTGALCMAQSTRPEDLAQGKIIITQRDSPDPHFANSVIVLAHYDESGALGLMLHYKSDLTIQKALKGVSGAENRTDPVYVGGPVQLPVAFGLLRAKTAPEGGNLVKGDLYLLSSKKSIETALAAGSPASELRMFIGYSGWAPGQLQREVRRSGWFIFDYNEALVFDPHPETLWNRLIDQTERRLAGVPRLEPWTYIPVVHR